MTIYFKHLKNEFKTLYEHLPQGQIYKRIGISLNKLMKIREGLEIAEKPKGRPVETLVFKDELKEKKQIEKQINKAVEIIKEDFKNQKETIAIKKKEKQERQLLKQEKKKAQEALTTTVTT